MLHRKTCLFMLLVTWPAICTPSQAPASVAEANAPARQDATAVQILKQAIQAIAVSPDALAYRSFALTGSILPEGASSPEAITVLSRGLYDLRFAIAHSDGTAHVAVMRSDAKNGVRDEKGRVTKIVRNARTGTDVPLILLPGTLADLLAVAGTIRDLGMDTVNGRTVHHVAISRQFPSGLDPDGVMKARSTIEFFIDADNFLVLKIAHTATDQSGRRSIDRSVVFADFRSVGGVMVPFLITESLGGQKTWAVTAISLDFQRALQDTDFQL